MADFKNIAAIQFQKNPEFKGGISNTDEVLRQFNQAAERLDGTGIDIVVTCEGMESVGQTMKQAESVGKPGPLMETYSAFAKRNKCCVAGSVKLEENGKIYNSLAMFEPDGSIAGDYRKCFLTDGEIAKGLTPGDGAKVIETASGKIGGVICFDLNFDEPKQEYAKLKPDLLAFASMFHGSFMQQQWAFSCQCFFAGACKDGLSRILDPLGRTLSTASAYTQVARARVNFDRFVCHLDHNRIKEPEIYKKYGNDVFIDIDPELGTEVLYSLGDAVSAAEIATEFGLIPMDVYFRDARKINGK